MGKGMNVCFSSMGTEGEEGKKGRKKEVTVKRRLAPVKGKRDGEETYSGDRKRGKGTILVRREFSSIALTSPDV